MVREPGKSLLSGSSLPLRNSLHTDICVWPQLGIVLGGWLRGTLGGCLDQERPD